MAIYACSDIHGQKKAYDEAVALLAPGDELYIVGDAIDRGPHGMEILLDVAKRDNVHMILGNHEFMALSAIKEIEARGYPGRNFRIWTMGCNGGDENYESFLELSEKEKELVVDTMANSLIQKILDVKGKTFCLCHSLFKETDGKISDAFCEFTKFPYGDHEYFQKEDETFSCVWYSPYRESEYVPLEHYERHRDVTFVIGHVPICRLGKNFPQFDSNVLNIDGGLAYVQYRGTEGIPEDAGALFLVNLNKLTEDPENPAQAIEKINV